MAIRGGAFALVALCLFELALPGAGETLVPAMFVFGDSTVDVGNNNHLTDCNASCKADHPPYGVDYSPSHMPTGRFSNGYNLADQLAQFLGFNKSPPAYLAMSDESIVPHMKRTGINFASGGSGLLERTGRAVCQQVFDMAAQVQEFSAIVQRTGTNCTAELISQSLFFISAGSNDLFEYVDIPSNSSRNDTAFLQSLVASYTGYLKVLYGAGARKFSVVSPSLIGCCPSQRMIALRRHVVDKLGCFGAANALSEQLYPMLQSMLEGLSAEMPGMNYSFANSVGMIKHALNGIAGGGIPGTNITVVDTPCCGAPPYQDGACNPSAPLCSDRAGHLFWDGYHPTDAASALIALELFADPGAFVRPMNVQTLAALKP